MRFVVRIFLLFSVVLNFFVVSDLNASVNEGQVLYDTSVVDVRVPDSTFLKEYLNNKDYRYEDASNVTGELSFWFRFWRRLGKYFEKISFLFGAAPVFYTIVLACLVVFFLLVLFTKTKLSGIFFHQKNISQIEFSEVEDETNDKDIDSLIAAEIANQNFRAAIRFMFIRLLRILESRNFISMSKGKTNFDYQSELKGLAFFDDFTGALMAYEYAWYGNFEVDRAGFESLSQSFNNVYKQLNEK
ncbi:MAG: hypothetical protein JXB00_10680 [Bacteroidales bacterium]|nr:hypothetical protein [Bacteroidales bacterium]